MYRCGNNNRKEKQGAIKRRNCWRHIALLALLRSAQLSSTRLGFLLVPTTSSSSDPCTPPLPLPTIPPLTSLSSASSSCAYLFAAFYAFICFDFFTISQRLLHCLSPVPPCPPAPVTPSRQCNLSISYTFRHTLPPCSTFL